MTRSNAVIGWGTLFQTGDNNSPVTWSALAEVKALTLPPLSRDIIDAGHECAPDEWREVLTGLKNAGDVSVECNFYKTTYQALLNELDDTTIKPRRIILPDGTQLVFNAYLTGVEVGVSVGDLISASAKFRVSGAPGPLTIT